MSACLRAFAVVAGLFVGGVDCTPAGAQTRSAASPQAEQIEEPETDPPAAAPPAPGIAAVAPSAPAASAPAVAQPAAAVNVVAVGARDPVARRSVHPAKSHGVGAIATLPGFEMLPEGGSRLFVEISQSVGVEEKKTPRMLTYVLKGARVVHRNNENALVTVHFNTPVTRARLTPAGRDLLFSVDLRADAVPAWKVVNEDDGTATLQIDFPKGSFLPAGGLDDTAAYPLETPHTPAASIPPSVETTPRAPRGRYRSSARGQHAGVAPSNPPPAGD